MTTIDTERIDAAVELFTAADQSVIDVRNSLLDACDEVAQHIGKTFDSLQTARALDASHAEYDETCITALLAAKSVAGSLRSEIESTGATTELDDMVTLLQDNVNLLMHAFTHAVHAEAFVEARLDAYNEMLEELKYEARMGKTREQRDPSAVNMFDAQV